MTIRIAVFILAASSTVLAQRAVPPARSHHPDIPYQSPTSLGAATYAKVLCSAVFVSGRDAEEAKQNSAYFLMTEPDRAKKIVADVDRQAKRVRVTVEDVTRTAAFYGDQGCVIHPAGHDGVHFKPVPVRTTLPDATTQAWPMGDAPSTEPWPAGLDRAKMQAAVDLAFADPAGLTAAMVVLYKGQIVGERYMAGITKDTQLESWSMGKSLTATLVGLVIKDGAFSLDDPAPVPDWRRPGDPRGAIRVRDVMNMSSGLSFTGQDDRWMDPTWQYHDHFFIYAGAVDAFKYAIYVAGGVRAEHGGAVSQFRSDDAGVPRASTRREEGRGLPDLPAACAVRQDRHSPPGARAGSVGQFPVERLRLRHRAQLGTDRVAVSARRRVERPAPAAGRVCEVRQHARARVAPS